MDILHNYYSRIRWVARVTARLDAIQHARGRVLSANAQGGYIERCANRSRRELQH
jgi:hypothetical protein